MIGRVLLKALPDLYFRSSWTWWRSTVQWSHELAASYSGICLQEERRWCSLQFRAWWGGGMELDIVVICSSWSVDEGIWLERAAGRPENCFQWWLWRPRSREWNTTQGWDEGPTPHVWKTDRSSRGKAVLPEILAKMVMSSFMGSSQQRAGQAEGPERGDWQTDSHREDSSNTRGRLSGDARAEASGQYNLMPMLTWPNKCSHPGKA